ncbi:pyridoxamine 5'-phosphate oxidase family protein [Paenibacillus sp. IHBB 10380]|uniref:pyridoxamine 5'-phosphate oxidase family protein n=1 Tax=Paenibacillus sp. IHBB 10380 TaxID=1566358 RepID=UPI0005CFB33F|nr:pyridoxamine 5'-phosphate oxidase family protein [Paenibacillus sp. IHBB 10380]AJS60997.1 general stress protein [Paenibacillus sp. IHBB 10380]
MLDKTRIEQEIVKALDHNKICSFATIEGNKPKQRYMVLFNEGLSLHLATNRQTHKVEELEENPHVSLLVGYEIGGSKDVIEIEGICSICTDESLREKVWSPELEKWFTGPNDPNYVILDIKPTRMAYTGQDNDKREWIV